MKTLIKTLGIALTLSGLTLGTGSAGAWDRDYNPPGPRGGPGSNWENPPGPAGGPGASPDVRPWRPYRHLPAYPAPPRHWRPYGMDRDHNPPGPRGGAGTNWENPPGPRGGPGASPNWRYRY